MRKETVMVKSDLEQFTSNIVGFRQYINRAKSKENFHPPHEMSAEYVAKVLHYVDNNLSKSKHAPLIEYEYKTFDKWYGPQGRTHSFDNIVKATRTYFRRDNPISTHFGDGIRLLLNDLRKAGIKEGSLRPISKEDAILLTSKSTAAGISYFSKKNDPDVLADVRNTYWNMLIMNPALVSTRDMRNKLRIIFMDDFRNVITSAMFLSPVYDVMSKLEEGTQMWRGYHAFERYATSKLKPTTLIAEGDADEMDKWVTHDVVKAYVTPVLKWLYHRDYHESIDAFNASIFTQPCVVGDVMMEGEHSLFSGQYPTQLYETIIMLVTFKQMLYDIKFRNGRLVDYATIEVIGDDVVIFLDIDGNKYIHHKFNSVYGNLTLDKLMTMYLTFAGLKANRLKQRLAVGNFFYCRRWYSWSLGSYSTVFGVDVLKSAPTLVSRLNSILHPEHGEMSNDSQELLRKLSILDDAFGHPQWSSLVYLVLGKQDRNLIQTDEFTTEIEYFNRKKSNDWKVMLNGEFKLDSSPSYKLLMNLPITGIRNKFI